MSEQRKLLTFLADFLLDEGEEYPLRGEALRQAVLRSPRAELARYGLRPEHVDLLMEHGPNPGVVLAAVRTEVDIALDQSGGTNGGGADPRAPFLWPGDSLFVDCLEYKPAGADPPEPVVLGPDQQGVQITLQFGTGPVPLFISGGGFTPATEFFFSKPGVAPLQAATGVEPVRPDTNAQIEACKDARQLVQHRFTFPEAGTYYLRVRERPGAHVFGMNDLITVTLTP